MDVREHMALQIAGARYGRTGRREDDMLNLVGMTAPRFWQYVDALLERPDAEAAYPAIVRRLKGRRSAMARVRHSQRLEHMPYNPV